VYFIAQFRIITTSIKGYITNHTSNMVHTTLVRYAFSTTLEAFSPPRTATSSVMSNSCQQTITSITALSNPNKEHIKEFSPHWEGK
jgi:hypothetical protein